MDVSALAGLHTLKLVRCGNVRNVSALAGCAPLHTLDLTLCLGVTDARGAALHTLDLAYCFGPLAGCAALRCTLHLAHCERMTGRYRAGRARVVLTRRLET